MMKNQCESCKKLVKMADILDNVCPKCAQAFRIEDAAAVEAPVMDNKTNDIKEEIVMDTNENKVVGTDTEVIENAAAPAAETTPAPVAKVVIPAELSDILVAGKKGVTNFQMIPAMKTAVDTNDVDKLVLLKQHFGPVFESTTKYIGKERKNKLIALELAI